MGDSVGVIEPPKFKARVTALKILSLSAGISGISNGGSGGNVFSVRCCVFMGITLWAGNSHPSESATPGCDIRVVLVSSGIGCESPAHKVISGVVCSGRFLLAKSFLRRLSIFSEL